MIGLGLAVVARIVEQLGGQLRVDSRIQEGSRFSFLIPFAMEDGATISSPSTASANRSLPRTRTHSNTSRDDQIDNLVQALSSSHMRDSLLEYTQPSEGSSTGTRSPVYLEPRPQKPEDSFIKYITHQAEQESNAEAERRERRSTSKAPAHRKSPSRTRFPEKPGQLRVLIVEVCINTLFLTS